MMLNNLYIQEWHYIQLDDIAYTVADTYIKGNKPYK